MKLSGQFKKSLEVMKPHCQARSVALKMLNANNGFKS